jgi:hypothetical protein
VVEGHGRFSLCDARSDSDGRFTARQGFSPVDLGDEATMWIGILAALTLQNGGDPTAATAVPVDDLWNASGAEMALPPVGKR